MRRRGVWLAAAVLGGGISVYGTLLALAVAATPEQVIADRRAGFKHVGENFKAMKDAVDSGSEVQPLAPKAAEILAWAKQIPSMFPPGTETGGGTHARPEIWSDRAGFDQHAAELQEAAQKLEETAQSGDKNAFALQWKATGHVCGGCHQNFRYKLS